MCHPCTWCALTNGILYALVPSVFPTKIAGVRSLLCSKRSSKGTCISSENFPATGGFFERNTYRITALHVGCLGCLNKERRRWTIFLLRLFQVCHFKIITAHCYYYCRLGQALYTARCTFRRKHLFSGDDIVMKTLIHWLEPPFWNQAIPTCYMGSHKIKGADHEIFPTSRVAHVATNRYHT